MGKIVLFLVLAGVLAAVCLVLGFAAGVTMNTPDCPSAAGAAAGAWAPAAPRG